LKTAEEEKLFQELLALAADAGFRVVHSQEPDLLRGGAVGRIKDQELIVLDSRAGVKTKITLLVEALKKIDWRGRYLKPEIREILERTEEEKFKVQNPNDK
jgi:hypothetical protein